MNNYFLNLLINIVLMAFAIISVAELIFDKSVEGSFFRKIKRRGWFLIIMALISIAFNFYRDCEADSKQEASDNAKAKSDSLLWRTQREILLLQIASKDEIIKKVDSTYLNSIKASNEALAKYNLKITDSLHAVVSKLKLDAVNPQLLISPLEKGKQPAFIINDKNINIFYIQFISKGGTSYHILLNCYLIEETSSGYTILNSNQLFNGESFIAEDILTSKWIDLSPDILDHSNVIIFLTGSFSKDPQGITSISYNGGFRFNFKDNKYLHGLDGGFENIKRNLNIK